MGLLVRLMFQAKVTVTNQSACMDTHTNFSCVHVPVLIALHVVSGCKSVCIATLWVTQIVWGQKARLHYVNQYILGGRHDRGQGLVKIRFSVIHIAVVVMVMVTICQQEMNVSQYNVL